MNADALRQSLVRVAPIAVPVLLLVLGWALDLRPRSSRLMALEREETRLRQQIALDRLRLRGPEGQSPRRAATAAADYLRAVSADDRVPDVLERVARLALGGADSPDLRELLIQTRPRVGAAPEASASSSGSAAPRVAPDTPAASEGTPDPRLALFPGSASYTPVQVSFRSSYERLGRFLFELRRLPTLVEIHFLEIERDQPLLKVKLELFAYQRTAGQ